MSELLAILKVIAAIPAIIAGFRDLVGWLEKTFGPDWAKRIEELQTASKLWGEANTIEERDHAVKAMALAFNSRS